jgi:hypothetical protein
VEIEASMMRWNLRRTFQSRVFAAAVGLALPVVCALAAGREVPIPDAPRSTTELAEERLKLAHRVLDEVRKHKPSRDMTLLTLWFKRIAQTRHEFGGRPDEVLADLKAYADHVRQLETYAEHNAKLGLVTEFHWLETRYQRLEAESWLAQASEKLSP